MSTAPYSYKVGDKHSNGKTIRFIYGQSPDVLVFEDDSGAAHWAVRPDELSPAHQAAQRMYDRLSSRLSLWLPNSKSPGSKTSESKEELRSALFLALCESDAGKAVGYFDGVRGQIESEILYRARVIYLRTGLWAAVLIMLIAAALQFLASTYEWPLLGWLALAVCGGAFGSWTSVLQRIPSLESAPITVPKDVMFQSSYRMALGLNFGLVSLLLVKTGVLAANFTSNAWQFFLFAFIAGFSERFIPELLSQAERTVTARKAAQTKGQDKDPPNP